MHDKMRIYQTLSIAKLWIWIFDEYACISFSLCFSCFKTLMF